MLQTKQLFFMTLNICFQPSPSACRSLHVDFKCQRNKPAVLRATYSDAWKDLLLQCYFHECFAVKQINKSVKCDRLQNSIQFGMFFMKFSKRFKASLSPPLLFLTVSNFYTLWAHFQEFVTAACLFPPAGHTEHVYWAVCPCLKAIGKYNVMTNKHHHMATDRMWPTPF